MRMTQTAGPSIPGGAQTFLARDHLPTEPMTSSLAESPEWQVQLGVRLSEKTLADVAAPTPHWS